MKRVLYLATLAIALFGCAAMSVSPEKQITEGANALTAATTLATVALKNDKITVSQAVAARTVLAAAGSALDNANDALVQCRKATGSKFDSNPDPCKQSVVGTITLALDSIANVKRSLDATK